MIRNGDLSFGYADIGGLPARRAALQGDVRADVCIIGAGYTGLWAAYCLQALEPSLDVLIVEREFAGFGASGRNGGWLTGGFAWNRNTSLAGSTRDGVQAMIRAMAGTVDEVIGVAETEGIDADICRTDELMVATNAAQLDRLRRDAAQRAGWGMEAERFRLPGQDETRAWLRMQGAVGALVIEGVARVQPAKRVQGLARAAERRGVRIAEGTGVLGYGPGRVVTDRGIVRAPVILRATAGFTAGLPGHRRDWLALNSALVVTEPLPAPVSDRIGWAGTELVLEAAHACSYLQRTPEGRIALGGRGVPDRFGPATDTVGQTQAATIRQLVATLRRLFPAAAGARVDPA